MSDISKQNGDPAESIKDSASMIIRKMDIFIGRLFPVSSGSDITLSEVHSVSEASSIEKYGNILATEFYKVYGMLGALNASSYLTESDMGDLDTSIENWLAASGVLENAIIAATESGQATDEQKKVVDSAYEKFTQSISLVYLAMEALHNTIDDRLKETSDQALGVASEAMRRIDSEVYTKQQVDDKISEISASPNVVQHAEQIVGKWLDPVYGERLNLWERIIDIDPWTLEGNAGSTHTVTLIDDLMLKPDAWLRVVDCSLCMSGIVSVFPQHDAVISVYQSGQAVVASIRKPELLIGAASTLSIQLRYVKMQAEALSFELKVPAATDLSQVDISFPVLKYFKNAVLTPTFDDSVVGAYCAVWATINRKRVYNTAGKTFFHKAWTPTAEDTYILGDTPLDFDNGTGRRIRYSFSSAIWATNYNQYSPDGFIKDSSDSVTNPYVCWDELAEMRDYGCTCMYHNVAEAIYGNSDPKSIAEGFAADREKAFRKLGVYMKIMGQPDGNAAYLQAAESTPIVEFSRANGQPKIYYTKAQDLYHKATTGGNPSGDGVQAKKQELINQITSNNPYWCAFTEHRVDWNGEWLEFIKWVKQTYSSPVWVTSWDNVYEWMYARYHGMIFTGDIRTEGQYKYIPVKVYYPYRESFLFRDCSLLFSAAPASCDIVNASSNILLSERSIWGGAVHINLNFDPRSVELAEKYTAIYEASHDTLDRESALYFTGFLSAALAKPYLDRIAAIPQVDITALNIAGPTQLAENARGTFTITATPSNTTRMDNIVISAPELKLLSRSTAGNVITVVYDGRSTGSATITASLATITASHTIKYVGSVPITSIAISGSDTIEGSSEVQYNIVCQPTNNTYMDDVSIEVTGGIRIKSRAPFASAITLKIIPTDNGPATIKASWGDVSAEKAITVQGVTPSDIPITDITITGDDTITGIATKRYTVTCLPADNTYMNQVYLQSTGGIRVKPGVSTIGNTISVDLESTADGQAMLQATAGEVTGEKYITVQGITVTGRRMVLSFGYDWATPVGGVFDANGGYTKIRATSGNLTGKVYDTTGAEAAAYQISAVPNVPGTAYMGMPTGDDSALYKDYAIKYYYTVSRDVPETTVTLTGLEMGKYKVKFFLNCNNEEFSADTVHGVIYITTEIDLHPVMPSGASNSMWYRNYDNTADVEVHVGANGTLQLVVQANTAESYNTASFQILDIEKIGEL